MNLINSGLLLLLCCREAVSFSILKRKYLQNSKWVWSNSGWDSGCEVLRGGLAFQQVAPDDTVLSISLPDLPEAGAEHMSGSRSFWQAIAWYKSSNLSPERWWNVSEELEEHLFFRKKLKGMKNVRVWASIKRALTRVQEGALDEKSGTQNACPALPSTSHVALKKSLDLFGFQWG